MDKTIRGKKEVSESWLLFCWGGLKKEVLLYILKKNFNIQCIEKLKCRLEFTLAEPQHKMFLLLTV